MLTVPAVGPRISLRPLGPSIPPHMYCSTPVAYVWARTTNNQAEYTVVIGLLAEASHRHIRHLSMFY
jgi:hypothetical protein